MGKKVYITIEESELKFKLYYTKKSIENCFNPIADLLFKDYQSSHASRYISAVAGPPGCGKSSIAHLLSHILKNKYNIEAVILPLDGFHYKNEYLKSKKIKLNSDTATLYDIKGAPETYDTKYFRNCLEKLADGEVFNWPVYSRKIHEPVENGIKISRRTGIFIIEGNYLLLDKSPWKELLEYYQKKIFIRAKEIFLKRRIINRKIAGGYTKNEAVKHYKISDKENIKRVLKNISDFDILVKQAWKYRYVLKSVTASRE